MKWNEVSTNYSREKENKKVICIFLYNSACKIVIDQLINLDDIVSGRDRSESGSTTTYFTKGGEKCQ